MMAGFSGRRVGLRMDGLEAGEFDGILLVFRVLVGVTFAAHGWAKMFSGGRIAGTAGWFDSMGMKPGRVHALAASITEMGGGALLILGLFTPFAGASMVGVMVVAAWTVHRGNFFIVKNGWEYNFVLALLGVVIAGLGPGRISLDHALGLNEGFNGWVGFGIALVLGLLGGAGQLAAFYRPPAPS